MIIIKGVQSIREMFLKSLELSLTEPSLKPLYSKIKKEYDYVSQIRKTGDLYIHFKKFRENKHQYADDFKIFKNYNLITNEEIADYLEQNFPDELADFTKVEDYEIGKIYSNAEIRVGFRCTYMGGIRPSNITNTIVVVANHVESLYEDTWDNNIFYYTGQGKAGNQKMNSKNLSLKNAKADGRTLHLFEVFKEGEYTYQGEVYLYSKPYISQQKDDNDELRDVYIFPLKLVKDRFNQNTEIFTIDSVTAEIIPALMEEAGVEAGEVILINTDPPKAHKNHIAKIQRQQLKKVDFIEKSKKDTKTGIIGEQLVKLYEKQYLLDIGREDLSERVSWVSQEADGYGYDILSFDEDGNEKYIEVKTTSLSSIDTPFDISRNEVLTSERKADQYWIYRVYELDNKPPKFYKIQGSIVDNFNLEPVSYKAYKK